MTAKTADFSKIPGHQVLADNLTFPESPRYARGEVYFSDGPAVRAVGLKSQVRTVAELPTPLCLGVQVAAAGTVYVCASFDRKIFRIADGDVAVAADLAEASSAPLNEFVLLPNGRILAASMGFDPIADGFGSPRSARLLLASPDGMVRETGPDMVFANGMVLRDDGRTLWVIESMAPSINRLSLDADGEVTDCTRLALHSEAGPMPDGLGMAADGSLWYADMNLGAVVLAGSDGSPAIIVDSGKQHVTSCLLFDADGQEWIVITATDLAPGEGDPAARTGQVLAAPLASLLATAS